MNQHLFDESDINNNRNKLSDNQLSAFENLRLSHIQKDSNDDSPIDIKRAKSQILCEDKDQR